MKKITIMAGAVALMATGAAAQTTTQQSVGGPTGDPVYSLRVIGENGVAYNCRAELEQRGGVAVRVCRRAGGTGQGGGNAATVPALIGGLALLAIGGGSDGSSTTSTSGTP